MSRSDLNQCIEDTANKNTTVSKFDLDTTTIHPGRSNAGSQLKTTRYDIGRK